MSDDATTDTGSEEYTFIKDFLENSGLYGLVPKSQRARIDALDKQASSWLWSLLMSFLGFTAPDNRQTGDILSATFSKNTSGVSADETVTAEVYNGVLSSKTSLNVPSIDFALNNIPLFERDDFNLASIVKIAGREAIAETFHEPISSAFTATGFFDTPEVQKANRALEFSKLHHEKIYSAIVERFNEMINNGSFPTNLSSDITAYAEAVASKVSGLPARSANGTFDDEALQKWVNPSKLDAGKMEGTLQYAYSMMTAAGYSKGSWIPLMDSGDDLSKASTVQFKPSSSDEGLTATSQRLLTGLDNYLEAQNNIQQKQPDLMRKLGLDPSADRDKLIWETLVKGGQIDESEINQYGQFMKPEVWSNLLTAITHPNGQIRRVDDVVFATTGNVGEIKIALHNVESDNNPRPIAFGVQQAAAAR